MGETLAETRVEIAARRADNEGTAAELDARVRHALDVKARFRENPLIFVGLGVGAVFLLAGGPALVFPLVAKRRVNPSAAEQAYDALPAPMQAWVDTLVCRYRAQGRRRRAMRWWRSWRAGATTRSRTRRRARSLPARWSMDRRGHRGLPGRRRDGGRPDRGRARPPGRSRPWSPGEGPFAPAKVMPLRRRRFCWCEGARGPPPGPVRRPLPRWSRGSIRPPATPASPPARARVGSTVPAGGVRRASQPSPGQGR